MNAFTALLPTHAMLAAAATSDPAPACPKCKQVGSFVRDRNFIDGSGKVWVCKHKSCESHGLYYYADPVQHLDPVSRLQHRIAKFQLSRFPAQTLDGKLAHLQREVIEVRAEPDDITEWADVFILILGAAACRGLTVHDLVDAAQIKMHINEHRQWGPADSEGVHSHISSHISL